MPAPPGMDLLAHGGQPFLVGRFVFLGADEVLMQRLVLVTQVADAAGRILPFEDIQLRHLIGRGFNVVGDNPVSYTHLDVYKRQAQYSRDLTQAARQSELDPVIGRDGEIQRIIQILSRRTKNNPVLIGEPGVGKSAVVEGLAQRIAQGNIPELLRDKRVLSLDMGSMIAGSKDVYKRQVPAETAVSADDFCECMAFAEGHRLFLRAERGEYICCF